MDMRFIYKGKFEAPKYQTEGAAGLDLFNNSDNDFTIAPNESIVIPTGVSIELPENFVGLVFPRSSLGFKFDTTLTNSVGVIDEDYRGEIMAKVINHSKKDVVIASGDRFCQLVIVPVLKPNLIQVDKLSETKRGDKGFGSTNK